jgi:recombination protein U
MNIKYPNGKSFKQSTTKAKLANKQVSYSNRGMTLEDDVTETNEYYLANKIAVIHKKPTPIQIVKVDYPSRSAAVVREAYFKQPSTTDFNGVYKGRYIDFEAKETKNKTSLPLQNFHPHQIEHMRNVINQQAICFVIIRFSSLGDVFFVDAKHIISCWDEMDKGGRKSIPYLFIEEVGHLIKLGYQPILDYLKVIDKYYINV